MSFKELKLWAESEEAKIHCCLEESLQQLINEKQISLNYGELVISTKLRKILYQVIKRIRFVWTLQPEASTFPSENAIKPDGYLDFRFLGYTPEHDPYNYDIECKLVRVKRTGKTHDYCEYYVTGGINKFQDGMYAQSRPPMPSMGTMIGYVQEGEISILFDTINDIAKQNALTPLVLKDSIKPKGVTYLFQDIQRSSDNFILSHLWADLRVSA